MSTLPELSRLVRPESHVPVLRWLCIQEENVSPVQLLILRDNKQLTITVQLPSFLSKLLLCFCRQRLKESFNVGLDSLDKIMWDTVVYQMQTPIAWN
jgi:hypothetical protein